jgi:maleylpyruvate isomerase
MSVSSKNSASEDSITLYHYWRSSCSWRVRWALIHKGISFQAVPVNLLNNEQNSSSFLKLNPGGYVPALQVGAEIFGESLAMLEWIEERFLDHPLLPTSVTDRMRVRQMCLMLISGTQPLQNLAVMRKHSNDINEQTNWSRFWIEKGLQKFNDVVRDSAGSFCLGGQFTLADICLIPQLYNARRFQVDLNQFPLLMQIDTNCASLPSYKKSSPEQFQDKGSFLVC